MRSMRWDNLKMTTEEEERLPGYSDPAVIRHFDAPEAMGVKFYEVRAKSALNRVPEISQVPFRWTINPYRGCSHACVFCASGETPILMADGTTKPIADLAVGDRIYGSERRGAYRPYLTTKVRDHWQTLKPAFRTTLEDGTELVTSGDHRFLTNRGWKHVAGSAVGAGRPRYLALTSNLVGTGAFAVTPEHDEDYRRGYICGTVRVEAALGSYAYEAGEVHRFRLALADVEALERTQEYLLGIGVTADRFAFSAGGGTRRSMHAI